MKSVELEESDTDPYINDLWEAFGWSEARKKLPNERSRLADESLKEASGSGWNTRVHSIYAVLAAATVTRLLKICILAILFQDGLVPRPR